MVGIPAMAIATKNSPKLRGWLLALAIFTPTLGSSASINFVSMETYRGPDRGFEVTLTDLICWGMSIGMLMGFRSKIKLIPFNTIPMLLFFCLCILGTAQSPKFIVSLFALFKFYRMYWIYWCVYNAIRIGVDRKYIWAGLVMVGSYLAFTCIKQKYLLGMYRVHGPFDHSNSIPMFVHMYLGPVLMWGLCDKTLSSGKATLTVGAAMGSAFGVVATQSRVGLLLIGMNIIGTIFLANFFVKKSTRVRLASVIVISGMIVGGAMAADTIIDRFMNAPESSGEARDEFNYAAELMANDKAFGVGLNCFPHVMTYTEKYSGHVEVMANEEHAGVVHHIYWLIASELGFPGLYVMLLIIFRFTIRGLFWCLPPRSPEACLLTPFMMGAASLWLTGLFEWAMRVTPQSYLYMIVSAILVGLTERVREQKRLVKMAKKRRKKQPVFT